MINVGLYVVVVVQLPVLFGLVTILTASSGAFFPRTLRPVAIIVLSKRNSLAVLLARGIPPIVVIMATAFAGNSHK